MPETYNVDVAVIDDAADGVTPAFYALARELAPRVAAENQRTLRELLEKEGELYVLAFELFRSVGHMLRREAVREIFVNTLSGEMLVTADKETILRLGRPVHDEYWTMADEPHYWVADDEQDRAALRTFDDVVEMWRKDKQQKIEDNVTFLSRWKRALRMSRTTP